MNNTSRMSARCKMGEIVTFATKCRIIKETSSFCVKRILFAVVMNISQLRQRHSCSLTDILVRHDEYEKSNAREFAKFASSRSHYKVHTVILEIYFRDNAPALAKRQRGLRTIDSAILSLLCEMDDIRIFRMSNEMKLYKCCILKYKLGEFMLQMSGRCLSVHSI